MSNSSALAIVPSPGISINHLGEILRLDDETSPRRGPSKGFEVASAHTRHTVLTLVSPNWGNNTANEVPSTFMSRWGKELFSDDALRIFENKTQNEITNMANEAIAIIDYGTHIGRFYTQSIQKDGVSGAAALRHFITPIYNVCALMAQNAKPRWAWRGTTFIRALRLIAQIEVYNRMWEDALPENIQEIVNCAVWLLENGSLKLEAFLEKCESLKII